MARSDDRLNYIEWGDQVVIRSKSYPHDYLYLTQAMGFHRWTRDLNEATVFHVVHMGGREYWSALKRHAAYARPVRIEETPSPQIKVIEPPDDRAA